MLTRPRQTYSHWKLALTILGEHQMDFRIWIVGLVFLAASPILLGQSTQSFSNEWTYNSKTDQMSGAATGTQRQAAQDVLSLELAEYRAWNSHDMQGVLAAYWNSPSLVSIAGDDEVHGFDALQKALLTTYANPNTMGHIDLDTLRVQVIADDSACCVASYVVRTQNHVYYCDDTATLRHFPEGWRIVFERAGVLTH